MEKATVYQLKIVLRGVKPPVWRRVLVPKDCTIAVLHETVQIAMGWCDCHLHRFLIRGKEYGVEYEGGSPLRPIPRRKGSVAFRMPGSHDPNHRSSARSDVSRLGGLEVAS